MRDGITYDIQVAGNISDFEKMLEDNVLAESQSLNSSDKWSKIVDYYYQALVELAYGPDPDMFPIDEENGELDIKKIINRLPVEADESDRFFRLKLIYREELKHRIIYTVHDYYLIVLLHIFKKDYNNDIRTEDIEQAVAVYNALCDQGTFRAKYTIENGELQER